MSYANTRYIIIQSVCVGCVYVHIEIPKTNFQENFRDRLSKIIKSWRKSWFQEIRFFFKFNLIKHYAIVNNK